MKTEIKMSPRMKWAIVIALVCFIMTGPTPPGSQAADALRAAVQAVQGDAAVTVNLDQEPLKLAVGKMVDAWNTVSTSEHSKLFLKWETGLLNSLGGSSSIFLASRETERGPVDTIEMTEGLLRVTQQGKGNAGTPYMVVTPAASIEPANLDEPVDFIIEVYVPATAAITVISGNVKVKNLTLNQPTETVLTACQTVYVEQGKSKLEVLSSSAEDLGRQVEGTTIPGTIVANLDNCPAAPQQRVEAPRVSSGPRYSDYEFEDWGSNDIYPYDDMRVLQPGRGSGVMVDLPGIGRWLIPIAAFSGWRYDPQIIDNYSRHVILDQMIYGDRYYLEDLRLQQQQFRDMIYLAQVSGNRDTLWDAQRQLANVNIQEQWTTMRLNRLESTMTGLEQEQLKFTQKLPQGTKLFQAVSDSFNSASNLKTVQNFRNKMQTDRNVQNQLAGLAGKELTDMRSRVAQERDPQKRMALRNELTRINDDTAQGKLPILAKQPQVKKIVEKLAKEQEPKKVQNLQNQLGRLTKNETPRTSELLSPDTLTSLKQGLTKFPNAQKRNDLEVRVGQLQQSVDQRKLAESNREKIHSITTQAAKQGDTGKREALLGQLKELEKTQSAGPSNRLNLLGQRQNLETQLSLEQDKQKRANLEKALEDHRKKQTDLMSHKPEQRKQPESLRGQQEVPQKAAESQKKVERQNLEKQQADELKKQHGQAEQGRRQQEQAQQQQRQQQQERKQEQREQVQQQQQHRQQEQAEQGRRQQEQAQQQQRQQQQERKQEQREQVQQQQQHRQQEQAEQGRRQQEQAQQQQRQQQAPQAAPQQRRELPKQQQQDPQKHQEQGPPGLPGPGGHGHQNR